MTNQPQIFDVGQDAWQVGITDDGRPYAVAADVAPTFDYAKTQNALDVIDDDEKGKLKLKMPVRSDRNDAGQSPVEYRNRQVWVIYEDGLWELIFRSTKPEAKQIKKRVKEVLRKLRADGMVVDEARISDEQIEAGKARLDSLAQRRLAERMDYSHVKRALAQGGAISDDYRIVQNTLYIELFGMTATAIKAVQPQLTGERKRNGEFTAASKAIAKNYLTEGQLTRLNNTVLAMFVQINQHYPHGATVSQMLDAVHRAVALTRPRAVTR
jgi:prophage antirepressor-like protein